jgi:hypothetical protein
MAALSFFWKHRDYECGDSRLGCPSSAARQGLALMVRCDIVRHVPWEESIDLSRRIWSPR